MDKIIDQMKECEDRENLPPDDELVGYYFEPTQLLSLLEAVAEEQREDDKQKMLGSSYFRVLGKPLVTDQLKQELS